MPSKPPQPVPTKKLPTNIRGDGTKDAKKLVSRISMSISEDLLSELDAMVDQRGFTNRSQAVSKIIHRSLVEHRNEVGDRTMVGTITIFYDSSAPGVQQRLSDLQRQHIAEVISSLHVLLDGHRTLEVILVQGPPAIVQKIADAMITLRGVIWGRLELVAALIPQLHPYSDEPKK